MVGRPRAWCTICHRVHSPTGFFSACFLLTGKPTLSYFSAAANRGWEARRHDLGGKVARMGAGRLGGLIQLV